MSARVGETDKSAKRFETNVAGYVSSVVPSDKEDVFSGKANAAHSDDPSFWRRLLKKMDWIGISRSKLKFASYRLYSSCTDNVAHQEFFSRFDMPDTFNSWFLVTELHVWLVLVRVMQEGKEGRSCRSDVVEAMWQDVDERSKALAPLDKSTRKSHIEELGTQFQAALFSYDEGLLANDRVLASALWRRFFQRDCDDVEKLEQLVEYVRRTVHYLESLDTSLFLTKGTVTWLALVEPT